VLSLIPRSPARASTNVWPALLLCKVVDGSCLPLPPREAREGEFAAVWDLSAKAEPADKFAIPINVLVTQVRQQALALPDEHEKSAPAVVILPM